MESLCMLPDDHHQKMFIMIIHKRLSIDIIVQEIEGDDTQWLFIAQIKEVYNDFHTALTIFGK